MANTRYTSAEDGNAIVNALGAMLMTIGRELSPASQEAIADGLRRIAAEADRNGQRRTALLISDLSLTAESQWREGPAAAHR